jgi:TonB family protein
MRTYLVLIFMATCLSSFAASLDPMTVEEAMEKGLLISAVRPDYPYEARKQRLTGSGIFELKFDYDSGQLREIHVVESTGYQMLDSLAIAALKLWKAKPHSVHSIRLPITFTLKRR